MSLWETLKEVYWNNKFLNEQTKEDIFYYIKGLVRGKKRKNFHDNIAEEYIRNLLKNQSLNNSFSIDYPKAPLINLTNNDPKLIAYYLPQYYPNKPNDEWWGKGSTEWTNTTKAVPQYLGQYQPRLPGELGFYDLRIQENIYRQVELAKFYGVYGFCFYYYWFDGLRLLDLPFNNFVNDNSIDFPFFICWVNESWTKQWSGNSNQTLVEQKHTVESYKRFITSCCELFSKANYITIADKPVLNVYKPNNMPEPQKVIPYWRQYIREKLNKEIYLIATIGNAADYGKDYLTMGFDAVSEFAPGPQLKVMNDITMTKEYVCDSFMGKVYDYKEFVDSKKYFTYTADKLFRAVSPMWDNTARKMNKGVILDGATPDLYRLWLKDVIVETDNNKSLDDKFIFINAWNEWAEGAYLEPDLKWQYGYLEATKNAILDAREIINKSAESGGVNRNFQKVYHIVTLAKSSNKEALAA